MAVDGRRFTSAKGSDDFHDFPCSPCSKEGKNIAAVKHCMDCAENLCTSCLNDHNKFSAMKGHQIMDKVQLSGGKRPQLPSQRCTKHGGRLIDVYCPDHDTVCCSTCIAVNHSLCRGIQFIPDVAEGVSKSKELQQLETEMISLESRLDSLLKKKHIDLKTMGLNKDELLKEIQSLRKKINGHLDEIEQALIDETTDILEEKMQKVEADEKKIETILAELNKSKQQLNAAKAENDSEVFVQLKNVNASVKRNQDEVNQMGQNRHVPKFKLKLDRTLENFTKDIQVMGKLTEMSLNYSATLQGEYDCRVKNDDRKCTKLHGICMTSTGNVLLTDLFNQKLKQLDCSYSLLSHMKLPGAPFGVCQINDDEFAVTLIYEKKVQFVEVGKKMRLLNSFTVGDQCRGVSHDNGTLYVCCGGWKKASNEGPGHIELYNKAGILLRSYFDSVGCPIGLAFSSSGKEMWIADRYKGLTIMDRRGQLLSQYHFEELQEPEAVCMLPNDTVCVSGRESNNVIIADDGKLRQILLSQRCGIKNPLGICYDEKRSHLIMHIYGHERVKVFKISEEKAWLKF